MQWCFLVRITAVHFWKQGSNGSLLRLKTSPTTSPQACELPVLFSTRTPEPCPYWRRNRRDEVFGAIL